MTTYLILNVERTQSRAELWWWKANHRGYTTDVSVAGRYAPVEVQQICKRGEDIAIELTSLTTLIRANEASHRLTGEPPCEHAHTEPFEAVAQMLEDERERRCQHGPADEPEALMCVDEATVRCLGCLRLFCSAHVHARAR